jgi:nucleotide-binding universal stress UspA family protein
MRIIPALRCVIVGFDGSPNSLVALRRAANEAQQRHARLDVIRVLMTGRTKAQLSTSTEWLRLRADVAHALPTGQHLTTRLHIAHGDPATALIKAADHAELLVIGGREHGEHGNLLGGATVPAVLNGSPCEVIICSDQTTATRNA